MWCKFYFCGCLGTWVAEKSLETRMMHKSKFDRRPWWCKKINPQTDGKKKKKLKPPQTWIFLCRYNACV